MMKKVSLPSFLQKRNIATVGITSLVAFLFVAVSVYGATTISTNINTGGTLTVTGQSTLTGAIYASSTAQINSTLTTYADAVFNENGAATGDFRIEGDTITSLFHADASADRVGIGTSTPSAFFSVGEAGGTVTGDIYLTGGLTVGATTTINSTEGTILLASSRQSDPTGVEGLFYYSAANKNVRLYNGSSWGVIGTSTGFDLSGRNIHLSDINNHFITLGTTTAHDASLLTLEATSTLSVPLTLVGETSQAANLFQIKNDADTNLFYVNSAGGVFGSSTVQFTGNGLLYGTLNVTGLTTLIGATTTRVSISENLMVGGRATTTGADGNITTQGTLNVTGLTTLIGATTTRVSISENLMVNGNATTTGSNGQFATQGKIGAGGTSTPATELAASGSATTTLYLHSTSGTNGGCLQLEGPDGTVFRLYATTSGLANIESGTCK